MAPPAVIYIVAVISTVAAAIAFKEFVYEPHIAPKLEAWATGFIEHRKAKRREAQNKAGVPARQVDDAAPSSADPGTSNRSKKSTANAGVDDGSNEHASYELERLVARELDDWRREVAGTSHIRPRHRSSTSATSHSMRKSSISSAGSSPFIIASPASTTRRNQSQVNRSPTYSRRSSTTASARLASDVSVHGSIHSKNPSVTSHDVARSSSDIDRVHWEVPHFPSRPESPFSAMSAPRSPSIPLVNQPSISHVNPPSFPEDDLDVFSISSTASSDSADENVRDDGSVWSWASDARSR